MTDISPFVEANFGWPYGSSGWNLEMDQNLVKFSYLHDGNIDAVVSSLPAIVNGKAYFNTTDNRLYFDAAGQRYSSSMPKWFVVTLKSTGTPYQFNGSSLTTTIVDVVSSVAGKTGVVTLVKADVGLANVDNTTDANKPVSTAQASALLLKTSITDLGDTVTVSKGAALVGRGYQVVNSITSLRALLKTSASAYAFVTGYYAAGDGGGGSYYLAVGDTTSVDNGGSIIVATDGGRWKLVHHGVFDVRQFGAIHGGGTDATASIQAAMNALSVAGLGGCVYLQGTYKYSSLTVPDYVSVHGSENIGGILLRSTTVGNAITVGIGCGFSNIKFAASAVATADCVLYITKNGVKVYKCEFNQYYIGAIVDSGAVNAIFDDVGFGFASVTPGGCMIFGKNYSNLHMHKILGAGPTLPGVQPSYGIRLHNGDTSFITDTNITLHGAALTLDGPAGNNIFATIIADSLFDSALSVPCGVITPAGNVYGLKISNTWFGLAQGASPGLLVNPSGAGTVDGLELNGCEFHDNGGDGLRVNGTGVKNMNITGGWACGGVDGINISGATSDFTITGFKAGSVASGGTNSGFGIRVQAGASNDYIIVNNRLRTGNTAGTLSDGGTGVNKIVSPNV